MKKVIFRGPTLTQSGYGVHARQIARWLLSRADLDVSFVVLPWGDTPWLLDRDLHDGLVGQVMDRSVGPDVRSDVSVQLQLPNEWDPSAAPTCVGITAGVETDRCHPDWVTACNRMSAVVFPSRHAMACVTNVGPITVPTFVIPEAFSDAITDERRAELAHFSTPFNFLVFGQLTGNNPENDRKNVFYTIKWLTEAFKDDPDVGIVIKTNMGRNSRIDRQVTKNLLTAATNEARRGTGGPKVHLLHGDMNDHEVAALYRHPQVKALVSLTRGEGFGLPILEAAASGLPIIATGWSGHLDFLRHGKYISVYYKLVDVHPSRIDDKIFVKGARWACPSEDDFKKRVTKFRHSSDIPREWAADLSRAIVGGYGLNSIKQVYDREMRDII